MVSQLVLTGSGAPIRSASVRSASGTPKARSATRSSCSPTSTPVPPRCSPTSGCDSTRPPCCRSRSVAPAGCRSRSSRTARSSARPGCRCRCWLRRSGWRRRWSWRWRCWPPTCCPTTRRSPPWSPRPPSCCASRPAARRSQGYQSGADRVDAIVAAICAAVQHRDVRYSEPPASWADLGQKVRTPGEVLDERVGTCLDLVVVLAAALEQAGIRPLLWLVEGHAFLGYWREELSAQSAATTDVASLVNLIDLGLIRLVETTLLTTRTAPAGFDELHRPPYAAWLTGDLDRVIGVTDVYRARSDGVLPLPAPHPRRRRHRAGRRVPAGGAQHPGTPSTRRDDGRARRRPEPPRRGSQQWKNALLDLSLRNRLINYTPRAGIALTVPDGAAGRAGGPGQRRDGAHPAAQRPAGRRPARARAALGPGTAAGPADRTVARPPRAVRRRPGGPYLTRLRALAYKAKTVLEETGANNLYLALGSLAVGARRPAAALAAGPGPGRPDARARAAGLPARPSTSPAPARPTTACSRSCASCTGWPCPAWPSRPRTAPASTWTPRCRRCGSRWPSAGCPTGSSRPPTWRSCRSRSSGCGRTSTSTGPQLVANPLVAHLVHSPTDPFVDPVAGTVARRPRRARRRGARCPPTPRSSRAVAEAAAGRTFVLEGPPGTGKSQTITNLLARAVADGKRVLFVAEKRAALDVVARRLDAVGHGPVRPRPARQGQPAGRGPGADPGGAGARGRRSTSRGSPPTARTCARPGAQLARYADPAARAERRRAVAVLRAHRRAQRRRTRCRRCRCRPRARRWSDARQSVAGGAARAGRAARRRRPGRARAPATRGRSSTPRTSTCRPPRPPAPTSTPSFAELPASGPAGAGAGRGAHAR